MSIVLDCTLRDGGYYNSWDFSQDLICSYLSAMSLAGVDVVELGLRSLSNKGFKGASAFTSDEFLNSLPIPESLTVSVMLNASELVGELDQAFVLERLFPLPACESPVSLVRIASHVHEFAKALPAVSWLKQRGYQVGFNLMQVADRSEEDVTALAKLATEYPIDVLYFADSMGSMSPDHVAQVIGWLRSEWHGSLGIHTHDNMGLALSNTLRAMDEGVVWVDATVTGMGRGPGNARTEELVIEVAERRGRPVNLVPLMALVNKYFKPMKERCGWGTNPYYYLAGKYAIHPSYIQVMQGDARYDEEDVLAVIEHLRREGGKKFSLETLAAARHFYQGVPVGSWLPLDMLKGKDVLLLGTGPGVAGHKDALSSYIKKYHPIVMALNTQQSLDADLIDLRVACHPVRMLADCEAHVGLPQPLITPFSMLPDDVQASLKGKEVLDFGIDIKSGVFEFFESHCTIPVSLVMAYALAVATSGQASRVLMAGFDGYEGEDPRNKDTNDLLKLYQSNVGAIPLLSVTQTRYDLPISSIYGLQL